METGCASAAFEPMSGSKPMSVPIAMRTPALCITWNVSKQDGWICFEALDNSGRRRLPRREPRWSELPPEELKRMLAEALDAPGRKSRGAAGAH